MNQEESVALLSSLDTVWVQMLDDTIKRLHVIAAVQAGNRINTRMHYVYRNTWVATVMRTLVYTETREHTIGYVRTTLDNLSAITARVVTQSWKLPDDVLVSLRAATEAARAGLAQLAQTYADDVACVAALQCFSTRLGVLNACAAR
jgi:hypothetical protein